MKTTRKLKWLTAFYLGLMVALTGVSSAANSLQPDLTVSWTTPAGQEVSKSFSVEDMKRMPVSSFSTTTSWTRGKKTFSGVLLKTFLEQFESKGSVIRATALNEYEVDIPIGDAVEGGPIIAYMIDDKDLTVRSKGPLWIVYPYDQDPRYMNQAIYSRSIWQLKSIALVD